jgi:hypothetical protein
VSTIITPVAAVDAIQRVPVACWLGPFDNRNGFPNFPVWCDLNGAPVDTLDAATHALWDGAFGATTAQLLDAIGADPAKVPADTSTLDRAALLELYAIAAQVTP